MHDRGEAIKRLEDTAGFFRHLQTVGFFGDQPVYREHEVNCNAAIALLKEQEAEIRQLRLALDIAKGTCKGIQSGGGQFADMPTMQSAT